MESPEREQDANDYVASSDRRRLLCEGCGSEDFNGGGDGFFYCAQCGCQSQDVVATEADADDVFGDEGVGALYSVFHQRTKHRPIPLSSNPNFKAPSKEEIARSLARSAANSPRKDAAATRYMFEDRSSAPQDFGDQDWDNPEKVVGEIRSRYLQGLQVLLQLQCETLVEKFEVSPMICGMSMTIWLKHVMVSRVFDDGWVEKMIGNAKVAANDVKEEHGQSKKSWSSLRKKCPKTYKHKFISLRCLRKLIPVYSTLAISFLCCHLAREAVLPTDFYKWVSESKLPYLSAFIEIEKYVGASNFPLSPRLMFRPIRIISASFLEVSAASIAQSIGLRTPSVNFYGIALRYLEALSLPVAKILPQACRLYEWTVPSELWLSSCINALPTRVYVMSILIVAIRILYKIHGHGIWEKSLSDLDNNIPFEHKQDVAADDTTNRSSTIDSSYSELSEFCTKDLLKVLDIAYLRINCMYEYSKDLRSYLKYCGDVIFSGLTPSCEGRLIERLWSLYDEEDHDQQAEKAKRPRDGESINPSMDSKKVKDEKQDIASTKVRPSSTSTKNAALESLKFEMEDNGFEYLPPRVVRKSDDYLHYRRQRADGKYFFVSHADYYILLRACAKVAEVDPRIMHFGVLRFEKRLDWIEQRIEQSLIILQSCSIQDNE